MQVSPRNGRDAAAGVREGSEARTSEDLRMDARISEIRHVVSHESRKRGLVEQVVVFACFAVMAVPAVIILFRVVRYIAGMID